jgi:hypothetical protein
MDESASDAPGYSHTQHAPLGLMLYGLAGVLLLSAWFIREPQPAFVALGVGGIVTAVVATAVHYLTVVDLGDALAVRFGPLPLPMLRMTIPYDDIVKVEIGRTLILDGWGIHYSVRGGWVWNIWGRDCVVVQRRNGLLRIGTDDAANLARFLEGKIGHESS